MQDVAECTIYTINSRITALACAATMKLKNWNYCKIMV